MANIIKHKRSGDAGAVPTAADLALGELAINTADGRLFTKKADGSVVDLTTSGGVDGGEVQYDQLRQGLMAFWMFDRNSMRVDDVSGGNVTLYEGVSEQTVSGFDGALRLAKRNFYYANNAFVGHKTLAMWVKVDTRFKGAYNGGVTYGPGDMVSLNGQLWRMHTFIGAAGYVPSPGYWTLLGATAAEYPLVNIAGFGAADQARIYFAPDGKLTWLPKVGTANTTVATATELPYAQWRHIVFVHDTTQNYLRIYENGVQTAAVLVSGAGPTNATAKFMLGRTNVVSADIDCLGVWNRALTPAEVQTLYGGGENTYTISAPPQPSINYEAFVTLNVTGAINTITASIVGNTNTLYPTFNAAIRDYGILTTSVAAGSSVTYTVTVNGVAYPGVSSVGKLIRVTNGTDDYYVRLLPSDMPLGTITTQPQAGYVPGYYITTSRRDINVNNYNIVYDENGVPVWYVQNAGTPHLAQHGNDRNKIGVSRNGTGTRFSMTITEDSIDTKEFSFLPAIRNGNSYQYNFGNHEFLEIKSPPQQRGNILYNTFVTQPTAGSQALTDKAYGVYVQEQTPQNTIGWEWWTSDRFDQTTLARNASFFHMNSVDIHPVTGDMLFSCRQCSAIVCVERATKNVKWVIQGASQPWGGIQQTANQYTLDNAKWLTLEGEPELEGYQYLGPEGQHHARWAVNVNPLTPGNEVVAIFDNQAGFFAGSTNSPKTVTALAQDGNLVTGTATAHGFVNGSYVKVTGANEAVFNGVFSVAVVNANTFTYNVATTGTVTATGTITATRALTYWPNSENSPAARGVIYEIDLTNEHAIHRSSAFAPNGTSGYLGSYQIMLHDNGSFSHVLNFTQQHPPLVEYGDAGDGASPTGVIFAVDFPGDLYRITKVSKDYFDIDYLRATAGLPITVVS